MIETAKGVVIRTRPLTETSLIVSWITQEQGRLATVAKGARRPKSAFQGKLDLFYEAEFSFVRSRSSELHTLREVRVIAIPSCFRSNMRYLQQACYCATFLEQTTETDTPLDSVYAEVLEFLHALPLSAPSAKMIFALELKFLGHLGLWPAMTQPRLSPEAAEAGEALFRQKWTEIAGLETSPGVMRELKNFLHGFLIYHLGRLPRGRDAAIGSAI